MSTVTRIVSSIVVGMLLIVTSCNLGGAAPTIPVLDQQLLFKGSDASVSTSGFEVQSTSPVTVDKVYFRSSDIEFWSIDAVSDIDDITSFKYFEIEQDQNGIEEPDLEQAFRDGVSLEYNTGDTTQSFVFQPGEEVNNDVSNPDLNPDWGERLYHFREAGNEGISLMRLDIGGGLVSFEIGGEEVSMTYEGSDDSRIGANSILFVDESLLSTPVLVRDHLQQDVLNGVITASDLEVSEADYQLVRTILSNSNVVDEESMIDVNGALMVPMTPIDLTGFDPSTDAFEISVSWDMTDIVRQDDSSNSYQATNRVQGTPFDFEVGIEFFEVP